MSSTKQLHQNIQTVINENNDLKHNLLRLIKEYKLLKQMVINKDFNDINEKKRSFNEIDGNDLNVIKEDEPLTVSRTNVSSDIFNFIDDEEIDEDMDSPLLSRTSSPLDDDNTSLMLSLTRSTTISSLSNSTFDTKNNSVKFFDLPSFQTNKPFNNIFDNLGNQFDVLKQDKYNLINDFLEEKLIDNDLNYYENLHYQD